MQKSKTNGRLLVLLTILFKIIVFLVGVLDQRYKVASADNENDAHKAVNEPKLCKQSRQSRLRYVEHGQKKRQKTADPEG